MKNYRIRMMVRAYNLTAIGIINIHSRFVKNVFNVLGKENIKYTLKEMSARRRQ